MYAMLVGSLPFTCQPFNIKDLCQKMMNGEMNALPANISRGKISSFCFCVILISAFSFAVSRHCSYRSGSKWFESSWSQRTPEK